MIAELKNISAAASASKWGDGEAEVAAPRTYGTPRTKIPAKNAKPTGGRKSTVVAAAPFPDEWAKLVAAVQAKVSSRVGGIPCLSPRAVRIFSETSLTSPQQDWKDRAAAFGRMAEVVTEANVGELSASMVDDISKPLATGVLEERSQINKNACLATTHLCGLLGDTAAKLMTDLLPALLDKTNAGNKLMTANVERCYEACVAATCFPKGLLYLAKTGAGHQAAVIRKRALDWSRMAIEAWDTEAVTGTKSAVAKLQATLDKALLDKDQAPKLAARALYRAFSERWPDPAAAVLGKLDARNRKAVLAAR